MKNWRGWELFWAIVSLLLWLALVGMAFAMVYKDLKEHGLV